MLGQFYVLWSQAANMSLGGKLGAGIALGSWASSKWQLTEVLVLMYRDHWTRWAYVYVPIVSPNQLVPWVSH